MPQRTHCTPVLAKLWLVSHWVACAGSPDNIHTVAFHVHLISFSFTHIGLLCCRGRQAAG
jgi:hypothetical protein